MTVVTCRTVKTRLSRFVDDELPAREAAVVQAHLDGCPDCRRELQALQSLLISLDAAPGVPPVPTAMAERIMARVAQDANASVRWGILGVWTRWPVSMRFAAAGTVAAACLIGTMLANWSFDTRRPQAGTEMGWVAIESDATLVSALTGASQ
jgi:anti-sigma factor RsiW